MQLSPLVGVVGETGDVLAVRARGGNASPRRKLASFIDECVAAIPAEVVADRGDSPESITEIPQLALGR